MPEQLVPLDKVRLDGGTQPRAQLDMVVIGDYAEAYERGESLPPIQCVFDGTDYWPWDGFHRCHGRHRAGFDGIPAEVRPGTVEDARWLALSANQTHGLRRTTEDKQRAVEGALRQRPNLSDRQIAQHVGVDNKTVASARARLTEEIPQSSARTGRDGRTIDTSNIGKRKQEEAAPPLPAPDLFDADADDNEDDGTIHPDTLRQLEQEAADDGDYERAVEYRDERLALEEGRERPTAAQQEAEKEKQEAIAQADARSQWLKQLVAFAKWVEQYVGQYDDDYLVWYTLPGSPGLFDHGMTPERIDAMKEQLDRVKTHSLGGNHRGNSSPTGPAAPGESAA